MVGEGDGEKLERGEQKSSSVRRASKVSRSRTGPVRMNPQFDSRTSSASFPLSTHSRSSLCLPAQMKYRDWLKRESTEMATGFETRDLVYMETRQAVKHT